MLYKVLGSGGRSCNGGKAKWNLPHTREDGSQTPGKWMRKIKGELVPCKNGYHLCRVQDILTWLNDEIYEAEYVGEILESEDKIVVRQCRLLRKCEEWTEKSARSFACWCVRNTPLSDGRKVWDLLDDKRSREAVEVAERYAEGNATKEDLNAAWAAAGNAAWEAARNAAWEAAGNAAWAAARTAAGNAARKAAGNAAWAAAWAAAWEAAWAAQHKELCRILNIEVKGEKR